MLRDKRVLVVEDEAALRAAIVRLAREEGCLEVLEAGSLRAARELLPRLPAAIITDVVLPDGDAIELVNEAARMRPAPIIVAMSGQASAEQAFALASVGTSGYLAKPFTLGDLRQVLIESFERAPSFDLQVAHQVGRVPMNVVQKRVRKLMVEQARAATEDNRTQAGKLLGVSRQAVQQIVRQD